MESGPRIMARLVARARGQAAAGSGAGTAPAPTEAPAEAALLAPAGSEPASHRSADEAAPPEGGAAERAVRLHVDRPALDRVPVVGGSLDVDGWACGREPIAAIEVWIDGVRRATCSHGYVRRDVKRAYPTLSGSGKSGYHGVVDLTELPEGPHEIEVRARTVDGAGHAVRGRIVVSESPPLADDLPGVPDWNGDWARLAKRLAAHVAREAAAARDAARHLAARPRFGLVVVVRDHAPELVAAALRSIRDQAYPDHETVAVVDGPTTAGLGAVLDEAAGADARLGVLRRDEPLGQARALAAGLQALGSVDYVSLLGAEDLLSPLALHALAWRVNERPGTRVLYTDGDHVTSAGERHQPVFLPDWSPHLLLVTDYLQGLVAFDRALVDEAGGIDLSLPGAHAHDLALRVTERTGAVEHVPAVLHSARLAEGGTRADRSPFLRGGSREAIERALARRGIAGTVETTACDGVYRVRRRLAREPLVSILVPTASTTHVGRCVRSVLERTRYRAFELLVLDTSCGAPEVQALLARLEGLDPRVRVIEDPRRPFSFAATNNLGAEHARGELLLPLNDDTEVLEPDWLGAMVGLALEPEVGVVGAKLLYPSGRIQHAGVVLGIGEIAGHAFRHFPSEHPGYLGLALAEREVGAATFACALVKRAAWERLGGLDAVNLPLSYNDVDFCLRAREAGYVIVYAPAARLLHFESATRGGSDASIGHVYIRRRFRPALARDPYYNPNLTLAGEGFGLDLEGDDE